MPAISAAIPAARQRTGNSYGHLCLLFARSVAVIDGIKASGVAPTDATYIVLSHGVSNHCGGASRNVVAAPGGGPTDESSLSPRWPGGEVRLRGRAAMSRPSVGARRGRTSTATYRGGCSMVRQ